ncbi:hypothetical protein MHAE_00030 [Mycobacterium haemophilum DSM 44634]|uniref:Uncharacterized protein n=1 Tax=Mycobacterium haemophilum TaxID=29311 RepID=A0A0I9YPT0_9MYCO|nr:hypothetical protein B586_09575 [Mycobacterium haemophilum DSM 44634]KLO31952.1 hypothetical protein ABH39_08140 [Mycobacterium haemophilum]KLO36303.1 hypothetical protein ABH38_12060 [Mycobacterium haemophilum]KLO42187.1 hypothetical protein ABH37_10690 [Mycobacterium haemophilum]KLO49990.1 hypothetical protein ABH36_08610 [Mycobacterium haemophilum]
MLHLLCAFASVQFLYTQLLLLTGVQFVSGGSATAMGAVLVTLPQIVVAMRVARRIMWPNLLVG